MTAVNDEFKAEVGKRLRALRERQGLTINEVVEKLSNDYYSDIDEKSIRRYEKGKFLPKIDNLISLAELFNTTLDYIIYGKETSNDNSFTWYDNFKRLNRLVCSLAVGLYKDVDGKIYLELWDNEAKVYFEKLNSYGALKNYQFENRNQSPLFSVKDLDALFEDFAKYNEQLYPPTLNRYNKWLESHGIDPDRYRTEHFEKINKKRKM